MTENIINFTKEGIGDDVLFLHGWGGNINSFKAIYSKISGYRCTSIDLCGFGKSPPPQNDDGWSVENYADNVAAFILEQQLKNLTVVGHSFGGRIAVVLAAKYPRLINKLVLVDAAGLRRFDIKIKLKILIYKLKKKLLKMRGNNIDLLKNYGSADFRACSGSMRSTFIKVTNQRLDRFARRISCPTLLVWGQNDRETPLWMAKKYRRMIKNSGLVVIKNCGHFCFLQNTNLFLAVLNSFLSSNGITNG